MEPVDMATIVTENFSLRDVIELLDFSELMVRSYLVLVSASLRLARHIACLRCPQSQSVSDLLLPCGHLRPRKERSLCLSLSVSVGMTT